MRFYLQRTASFFRFSDSQGEGRAMGSKRETQKWLNMKNIHAEEMQSDWLHIKLWEETLAKSPFLISALSNSSPDNKQKGTRFESSGCCCWWLYLLPGYDYVVVLSLFLSVVVILKRFDNIIMVINMNQATDGREGVDEQQHGVCVGRRWSVFRVIN